MQTLDLAKEHAHRAYPLLSGLITPRPIALITTLNPQGKVNAAPFSFFSPIGTSPAMLVFAPGDRSDGFPKDTYRNLKRTGECVVHIIDEPLAEIMNFCASDLPWESSEVEAFDLKTEESDLIRVPRLKDAPVAMECKYFSTMECGHANRAVFVTVLNVHVREGLVDASSLHVNAEAWFPIGLKAAPQCYCRTADTFNMQIPK